MTFVLIFFDKDRETDRDDDSVGLTLSGLALVSGRLFVVKSGIFKGVGEAI